jgi:hypothetical protein
MKKFLLHAVSAAFAMASSTFPTSAAQAGPVAGPGPDVVAFCREHITEPGFTTGNVGECTSYFHTLVQTEDGFVAHYCDGLEEIEPAIFYAMFDSKGDCVRYFRHQ